MNEHPSNFVHLMSDVEVWKYPDRNYMTFIILSILLGFFGVDHIYLRSFPTAIAKTVVNLFTLGLWYFWDILQIVNDGDRIKKEGLNSPFDWVKGIGRGVFATPGSSFMAPKDYVLYTILTFFGCLGADKFYLGEYGQGIVKLISCFNIFLFLFGWFWVAWDMYHAVFTMRTVMTEGISSPLPYSLLFTSINARSLFTVQDPAKQAASAASAAPTKDVSWLDWLFSFFPSLPALPSFLTILAPFSFLFGKELLEEIYRKLIVPIFGIGESAATIATQIGKDGASITAGAASQAAELTNPGKLATLAGQFTPAVPDLPAGLPTGLPAGLKIPGVPAMKGGARPSTSESGLGPVLAGSIAALVLAGGAKGFYDFIRKQL
jgi:TM2 domain-containing membrane protein YozV